MDSVVKIAMSAVLTAVLVAGQWTAWAADKAPEFKTDADKVSYLIGMDVASNMQRQGIEIKSDFFMRGMQDALKGSKPALSEAEITRVMNAFKTKMMAKQAELQKHAREEQKKLAAENTIKSKKFLDDNKKKPGVKVLDSGLQYNVLVEGKGPKPKPTDTVMVNYRGTLMDGTEFDSSYKRGEPFQTAVTGRIIKGWQEALQNMTVGSKWHVVLPPDLAYGEMGTRGIPPASALVFDIELLKIVDTSPATSKK